VAAQMPDRRDPAKVRHPLVDLLRQRMYGLACGYEDLNDHDTLRNDIAFQTAVEKDQALGSRATLCRFEQQADRTLMWRVHDELLNPFIASYETPPPSLILDFDATDDPVHGQQEGRFFHGYYRHTYFLPLYVFCGNQCLVRYLRPSNIDGAKHSWAILALLVKRQRQAWPQVQITFRGDSGFCRHRMLDWCERYGVHYLVGLVKNQRLTRLSKPWIEQARSRYEAEQQKQRPFTEFPYQAGTWKRQRRVLHKAEHMAQGSNLRYVVTNLAGDPQPLRAGLLRPRRDGKSHQGTAVGFVRRPHQLQPVVAESAPLAAVDAGLHAGGGASPDRIATNRAGAGDLRDHSTQAVQDRRRGHPQYPPHSLTTEPPLSLSSTVTPFTNGFVPASVNEVLCPAR
jgi:hypothetical protein